MIEKAAGKINYVFPVVSHGGLHRYSKNKIRIKTNYLEIVDTRWRLISGALYSVIIAGVWVWLSFKNYMGFDTFWNGAVSLMNPFNAVMFSGAVRAYAVVFWTRMARTSVLIGDTDNDPSAEDLAHRLCDTADTKKVKIRLIKQGRSMRAYFRNDEEAVLIRASA